MQNSIHTPIFSVVIPCRDHAEELKNCLKGFVHQTLTLPYEIIVVNSIADSAVSNLVAAFSNVREVISNVGLLPGAARNLGAVNAIGKYLVFVDADCIPEPGLLAAAYEALVDGAVIVGGPVVDAHPFNPISVADNILQFPDLSPNRPDGESRYFPGCNVAMSQSIFNELGGFPPDIPVGEDILFSTSAAFRLPGSLRFVNGMRVRHRGRTKLQTFWKHQEVLGFYRGILGLRLRPVYQRLSSFALLSIPIACKRLLYIMIRTADWNPAGLLRIIILLPILLFGLTAWVYGFRLGCIEAKKGK